MSLLERLGMKRHLSDADLAEVWTATTLAESRGATGARAHLRDCGECRTRYNEFTGWMDGIRSDARAEADEAFPAERLAAQQAQILRRLETASRPARIIAFPRFAGPVSVQHPGRRWIAAAAAAGLVVGIGLGRMVDFSRSVTQPDGFAGGAQIAQTSPAERVGGLQPASASANDEWLLYDPEPFSTTSSVRIPAPLQHINAITPGARDFEPR